MVGGVALRGWQRGVHAVLGAGRPACDALHRAAARNRADDADGQPFVECRADAAFIRCLAWAVGVGEGGPTARRNTLPAGALSTFLAVERTATAAANEGVARTMNRRRKFAGNRFGVAMVIALV